MNPVLLPANITSGPDMLVILVLALIVFGPRKLPEIGRQIGMAMREFNKMRNDVQKAFQFDEYTNFDTTPSYHPAPYGPTYPAITETMPAVDPYLPAISETVYHDDPLPTVSELPSAMAATETSLSAKAAVAPPPGPAALRDLIAKNAPSEPTAMAESTAVHAENAVE